MSDDEGNNGSKDLLAQITGDPSAMANLLQALIPILLSSLEDALASKEDGSVLPSNPQLQGERDRQSISRGSRMMSPQQMQGLGSNYPMGNPAQQNQTLLHGYGQCSPTIHEQCSSTLLGQCSPVLSGVCSPSPSHGQLLPGQCSPRVW